MQKEDREAGKYGLSLARSREFKRLNLLRKCIPPEGATCGSASGILASLLNQYKIDDLMNKKNDEHKKGKELFLGSLFTYILEHVIKNEMAICIPFKDNGTDIYVREIDYGKKQIIMHPIQFCEFPEKFVEDKTENFTIKLFNFIKKTKFKYPKSNDALLIWLEPEINTKLDLKRIRELFKSEKVIPFGQITLMGRNNDKINICCLYSKEEKYYFSFSYNWKNNNIKTT